MDMALLKTLIPLFLASAAALIAIVKVKAKADQTHHDLSGLKKDLERLEKDAHHTTRLLAQMEQVEKNVSKLWTANDDVHDKLESHRDRLDERFIALRDRFSNGNNK